LRAVHRRVRDVFASGVPREIGRKTPDLPVIRGARRARAQRPNARARSARRGAQIVGRLRPYEALGMKRMRPLSVGSSLVMGIVLVASCAAPGSGTTAPPRAGASSGDRPAAATDTRAAAGTAESGAARHHARSAVPVRPPPPRITTAMPGEPSAGALAEARLVTTSCEDASSARTEAQVKEMRAAVDRSFKEWHDSQPGCWQQSREQYRWRHTVRPPAKYAPRAPRALDAASPWGGSVGFGTGYGGGYAEKPKTESRAAAPPPPAATATAAAQSAPAGRVKGGASEPRAARSASGTNNQVASVDEADIVKTDGRWVYFAANGALRIAQALDPRIVSVTKLPGVARELFVEGDRAVVYVSSGGAGTRCTYGYDCAFGGDGTSTKIMVFDLASREEPKLARTIELSGSLIAARRIGTAVHTVVSDGDVPQAAYATWPAGLPMCGTPEREVRAKFAKLKTDDERAIRAKSTTGFPTLRDGGPAKPLCHDLLRTAMSDGQAFTTVVSFDMKDDRTPATTATVESRPGAVFASSDALYMSVVHRRQTSQGARGRWYSFYPSVDEVSEVHAFRIGERPADTRYSGSGVVPGHVLNQLAMDEWAGYLRIATTRGRVPDPRVESAVSILAPSDGGNLVRVGAVEKIAPGEDIRAVRFDGDRGYVVTFKKTDPLFVMDLYHPAHPAILGELEIPGFSTYLHRIDPEHLLSIGFDANDHGSFAYFDGVILQLFDVKNPTEPKLLHREKIGTRGSSSAAATDHLAFNYFADRGLLAIPMTVCDGGGDGRNGDTVSFSGLLVYDVDLEKGFTKLGGVDHGGHGVNCGTWWSNATSAVKRSIFLDDLVYSIASDRAKVQRLGHLGQDVADLPLGP
jgi:hypothetical protein